MIRTVVVFNRRNEVIATYAIEVDDGSLRPDDEAILAARRKARDDRRNFDLEEARFAIGPLPNLPI